MTNLPPLQQEPARMLTRILKGLSYKIFLAGGAAMYMRGGKHRNFKDLDFRIKLPFDFNSARGQSLIEQINEKIKKTHPVRFRLKAT